MKQKIFSSSSVEYLLLLCTLFVTPIIYVRFKYNPIFVVNLKWIAFQITVLSALITVCFKGKLKRIRSPLDYPIFAFVIICILSSFFSISLSSSINASLRLIIQFIFYILLSSITSGKAAKDGIFLIIVVTAFVVSIYSILQHIGIDPLNLKIFQSGQASSTFINWNLLGGMLIYAIPINLYQLFRTASIRIYILYTLSIFTIITCLFLTQSRGSWLGIIGALIFFVILKTSNRIALLKIKKSYCYFSLAFILLLAFLTSRIGVGTPVVERFKSITDYSDPSIKMRFVAYQTAIDIIKDYPIAGSGIDTYKILHPKYQGKYFQKDKYRILDGLSLYVHNDYLQIWSETGIAGICIFVWILAASYYTGIRNVKKFIKRSERDEAGIIITILSSLSALLIHSIFHYPFYMPTTGMLFWLTWGLLSAVPDDGGKVTLISFTETTNTGIFAFSVLSLMFSIRLFMGNIYCESGYVFAKEGERQKALKDYSQSISLNPWHADTYYYSGNIYSVKGDYDRAEEMYEQALLINPYFQHVYDKLGVLYVKKGIIEKAEEMFKEAIRLNPNFQSTLFNLGLFYERQERYDHAIEMLKEVIILNPNYDNGHYNLANVYFKKGMFDKAIKEFQKTLEINPDHASAHKNIGIIYAYNKKRYEKAVFHWSRYLLLNPSDKEAVKIKSEIDKIKSFLAH